MTSGEPGAASGLPATAVARPFEHRLPFFYGWLVLAVATLGFFMSGPGQTYGVSIFIDPMLAELGWSRSVVSGAYSAATLTAGLAMLIFGHIIDRWSARIVITAVAVLFGAGCLWMSFVSTPLGLLAGFTALRVLGASALTLACSTLAARWFVQRRGRAMSIIMLGSAASNALMPPVLQVLVDGSGWRSAWLIAGLAVWATLLVPVLLLLRDRPEAVGLQPDGVAVTPQAGHKQRRITEYTWTFKQAIRSGTFWLLTLASIAPACVTTGLIFHQVSYFSQRGLPPEMAASSLSLLAVAFAATTFVIGFALERLPERFVLMSGLLLLPVAVFLVMVMTTPLQALIYGALLGVVIGTNATTSSVLWAAYYGRQHLGSIRGVTQGAMAMSAAAGPLILSLPYDLTGSYTIGLWIMAALPLLCAAAAALAGPPSPPPARRARG